MITIWVRSVERDKVILEIEGDKGMWELGVEEGLDIIPYTGITEIRARYRAEPYYEDPDMAYGKDE